MKRFEYVRTRNRPFLAVLCTLVYMNFFFPVLLISIYFFQPFRNLAGSKRSTFMTWKAYTEKAVAVRRMALGRLQDSQKVRTTVLLR